MVRKGDGTGLAAKGYSQVRKGDGTVLWNAIFDSEELNMWYDFSDLDSETTTNIPDQSGNGFDLTEGQISGVGVDINGTQAAEFDGDTDYLGTGSITSEAQPNIVFAVIETITFDISDTRYLYRGESTGHQLVVKTDGSYNLQNDGADVGDITNSPHIIVAKHSQTNAKLRINGVTLDEPSDGALQDESISDLEIARTVEDNDRLLNIKFGEFGVYHDGDESRIPDLESYLSDKYDIPL